MLKKELLQFLSVQMKGWEPKTKLLGMAKNEVIQDQVTQVYLSLK